MAWRTPLRRFWHFCSLHSLWNILFLLLWSNIAQKYRPNRDFMVYFTAFERELLWNTTLLGSDLYHCSFLSCYCFHIKRYLKNTSLWPRGRKNGGGTGSTGEIQDWSCSALKVAVLIELEFGLWLDTVQIWVDWYQGYQEVIWVVIGTAHGNHSWWISSLSYILNSLAWE